MSSATATATAVASEDLHAERALTPQPSYSSRRPDGGRAARRAAAGLVSVVVAAMVAATVLDRATSHAGRGDLAQFATVDAVPYAVALSSAVVVGYALATRNPRHPVGWLFLGLGAAVAISAAVDGYATYTVLASPGALAGGAIAAVIGGVTFVPWSVLLMLILLLTPTGHTLGRRWDLFAKVTVAAAVVSVACHLVSDRSLDAPLQAVHNPLAVPALDPVLDLVMPVTTMATMLALAVAGSSIVLRFRRADGIERRQLQWLVVVAALLPVLVVAAVVASSTSHPFALSAAAGAYLAIVPIAAGLAVSQYHLYDVDRIVSRATSYALSSVAVFITYAVVVLVAGAVLTGRAGGDTTAVAVATLAACVVARPAHTRLQDAVDRRFNRRRFDATSVIRAFVRDPTPGESVEKVLQRALGDDELRVSYWIADRGQWVTEDGHLCAPAPDAVQVSRGGRSVAAIESRLTPAELVAAVATEASPELESTQLRAAIGLQLVEVRESRARLVTAQLDERRMIERNLHDGAQQRLVGLSFQLAAASRAASVAELRTAIEQAKEEARAAVQELRELANGLHPAILTNGGLSRAIEGLAGRSSVPVRTRVTAERFTDDVEATAWFIVLECAANAAKHAHATALDIDVEHHGDGLFVRIHDDGGGGADPTSSGLRGIRDRAEAIGGTLTVESPPGAGTTVEAVIPAGARST